MSTQQPSLTHRGEPDWLPKLFKAIRKIDPGSGVRPVTELEEVLRYFRLNVPDAFDIRAGLLFRQRSGGTYLVAQCFLATDDRLGCDSSGRPYGRVFRTFDFDNGLNDLFGHKDLIIFT
jgi:hypothetical protein